jgi:hypothetical protein
MVSFELKQEFIPANDFDDVKSVIEKKQLKAYPNQSLFRKHCNTRVEL